MTPMRLCHLCLFVVLSQSTGVTIDDSKQDGATMHSQPIPMTEDYSQPDGGRLVNKVSSQFAADDDVPLLLCWHELRARILVGDVSAATSMLDRWMHTMLLQPDALVQMANDVRRMRQQEVVCRQLVSVNASFLCALPCNQLQCARLFVSLIVCVCTTPSYLAQTPAAICTERSGALWIWSSRC